MEVPNRALKRADDDVFFFVSQPRFESDDVGMCLCFKERCTRNSIFPAKCDLILCSVTLQHGRDLLCVAIVGPFLFTV